jgi:succinate dehydrogenase/fumarate reductase flavoprotein subunit
MNRSLIERHCRDLAAEGIEIIGSPHSDGAGIELGLSVGAVLKDIDAWFATSPIYPPASLLEGILVNRNGQRFVAEDSYHGRTTAAILRQPGRKAWLICDVKSFDRPVMGQQLVDAWENVYEMERDLGMPTGALQTTIAEYNRDAAMRADPQQHKDAEWLRPIDQIPLAAIDCSPGSAPFMGFTLGGLATDPDGRVLDAAGDPIAGLYAAGATAANIASAQGLEGYASGTCIGESTFFGRRAGRHAASSDVDTQIISQLRAGRD